MKRSTLAACVAAAMSAAISANATELRMGMTAPEATPWGAASKKMAETVAELSSGELTIDIFYNNELGDGQNTARQIARGRIDMGLLSNVEASLVLPEYGLLNSPYLFSNLAQVDCVMDEHLAGTFNEAFEQVGAVYLAPVEVGGMQILSKTPVRVPADVANVKLRTSPAPTDTYFVEATGAAAVPLSVPDTMPALKTGSVSGLTTPIIMAVAGGYSIEAPEITLTQHSHQIGAILLSKRTWDKLDDNQRNALVEGAKVMSELRESVRAAEGALLEKAKAAGANVYELSDAEKAEWKNLSVAAQDKILDNIGGNSAETWTELQAASAACAR